LKKAACINPWFVVSSDGKVSLMRGVEASSHNSTVFCYGYFGGDAIVNIIVIYSYHQCFMRIFDVFLRAMVSLGVMGVIAQVVGMAAEDLIGMEVTI
jgi:hypothetical protein